MDAWNVAVVGGGCSGVLVVSQLLRQGFPGHIAIIEPRPTLGRGLAYSTPYDEHLLNVPAGKMSAFPGDPSHFLEWLRSGPFPEAAPGFFAPRKVYGDYLESVLKQESQKYPGRVIHIQAEATRVTRVGNLAEVTLTDGSRINASRVVLALGNPASSSRFAHDVSEIRENWFVSPWLDDALTLRRAGEQVLLIGTGLTAVDAALVIQGQDPNCRTYMLSRRGILPHVHNLELAPAAPPEFVERGDLRSMFRQLRELISSLRESDLCWRIAIDSLRPISNQLWQELPICDRDRFMRHLKTYWESHRHRMAPDVHRRIESYRKAGQVTVIAGRLRETRPEGDGVEVSIRLRNGASQTLAVDRIINCTGIHENYVEHPRPIVGSLIREGLASANDLGIGLRTDSEGALIDGDGRASSLLFSLGPPRRGDLIETTAVPEIRSQAESLAALLVQGAAQFSQ